MKTLKSTIKAFALVGEVSKIGLSKGYKQVAFFLNAPADLEAARQDAGMRPGAKLTAVELPLIWSVQNEVTAHSAFAVRGHEYFAVTLDRDNMPEISGVFGADIVAPDIAGKFVLDMRNMDKLPCPFGVDDFQEDIILNLTQHAATPEQVAAGVVEPSDKAAIQTALTFDAIPTLDEIRQRAELLADIAQEVKTQARREGKPAPLAAMIGGAPFLMAELEYALIKRGINPLYAFSVRDSVEQPDGNGGVKKINVFRHAGFVEVVK